MTTEALLEIRERTQITNPQQEVHDDDDLEFETRPILKIEIFFMKTYLPFSYLTFDDFLIEFFGIFIAIG